MIDTEFDLKITFRNQIIKYINENPQNVSKVISVSYSFSLSTENHPCNRTKEKTYYLFVYSCNIFPVIDLYEHINTIFVTQF